MKVILEEFQKVTPEIIALSSHLTYILQRFSLTVPPFQFCFSE